MPITPEQSRIMARWMNSTYCERKYDILTALVAGRNDPDFNQWDVLTPAEKRSAIALSRRPRGPKG